jgi:hypothetical protein
MAFVGVKEVPTGLHSNDPTYFNSVGLDRCVMGRNLNLSQTLETLRICLKVFIFWNTR